MLPIDIREIEGFYFAKNILINLTGFATMMIWRFSSSFPQHVDGDETSKFRRYQSLDNPQRTDRDRADTTRTQTESGSIPSSTLSIRFVYFTTFHGI